MPQCSEILLRYYHENAVLYHNDVDDEFSERKKVKKEESVAPKSECKFIENIF